MITAPADDPGPGQRCAELLAHAEDPRPAVSTRALDGLVSSCPERLPALLPVLRAHLQRGTLRFEHVVRLRGMIKHGGEVAAVHGDEIAALLEQIALSPAMFSEARTRAIEGVALHDRARGHALAMKLCDDPDHRVAAAARSFSRLLGR